MTDKITGIYKFTSMGGKTTSEHIRHLDFFFVMGTSTCRRILLQSSFLGAQRIRTRRATIVTIVTICRIVTIRSRNVWLGFVPVCLVHWATLDGVVALVK